MTSLSFSIATNLVRVTIISYLDYWITNSLILLHTLPVIYSPPNSQRSHEKHKSDGVLLLLKPSQCSYNEIQTFPYKVHLTSHRPTSVTSTPVILSSTHCTLTTLAFFLLFEHMKLILSFQRLVPLPEIS